MAEKDDNNKHNNNSKNKTTTTTISIFLTVLAGAQRMTIRAFAAVFDNKSSTSNQVYYGPFKIFEQVKGQRCNRYVYSAYKKLLQNKFFYIN